LMDIHPHANRWVSAARRWLEEQIADQFCADGWYAQHSFTYMRVALEQGLLAQRVLMAHGMTLSAAALSALESGFRFLVLLVDARTGRVPNHGANDGGRVAVFSTAEYRDFRPVLTLAALTLHAALPADITPDPEVVLWFGGAELRVDPARGEGVWSGSSAGWVTARVGHVALFLRAGKYRHRPSHLDALHLDVRFGSVEAITDPGTFAYNAPAPWSNPFTGAQFHNGPVLDNAPPVERGPRFLWYSWPMARVLRAEYLDGRAYISADIPGHVRREIEVTADSVRVIDTAVDSKASVLEVSWLVHPDCKTAYFIDTSNAEHVAAADGEALGWFSPSYGLRLPSVVVRARGERGAQGLVLQTVIHSPVVELGDAAVV
jgi:hypothetical protein